MFGSMELCRSNRRLLSVLSGLGQRMITLCSSGVKNTLRSREAWGTFPSPFQVGIGGAEPFWAKTTAAANSNVTATHEDNHLLGKDSLQSARRRTGAGQDFVEISGIIAGLN